MLILSKDKTMNKTVKLTPLPELPSYRGKQVPPVLTVALGSAGAGRGICIELGFKPKTAYKMSSQLRRIIHTLWKTSHDHSALTNTHIQTDLERSIGTSQATFSQRCWMCFCFCFTAESTVLWELCFGAFLLLAEKDEGAIANTSKHEE